MGSTEVWTRMDTLSHKRMYKVIREESFSYLVAVKLDSNPQ